MIDGLRRRNFKFNTAEDLNGEVVSMATGSPSTFGALVQGGEGTLGAGSELWITFGTAYSAKPFVTASHSDHTEEAVTIGSITAGSALAIADTASTDINWIAIGAP